jgi:hypothetical protein
MYDSYEPKNTTLPYCHSINIQATTTSSLIIQIKLQRSNLLEKAPSKQPQRNQRGMLPGMLYYVYP